MDVVLRMRYFFISFAMTVKSDRTALTTIQTLTKKNDGSLSKSLMGFLKIGDG